MDDMIHKSVVSAVSQLENQLDNQIEQLDNLDTDDLQTLRNRRLAELKELNKKKQEWLNSGHGQYAELRNEKEFFELSTKSPNMVVHFFRDATDRCKIVDMHFKILAPKHLETRFCKLNAEQSPFLTNRLNIRVLPTIAIIKDGTTTDYIIGFNQLGGSDDFTTEMLEWRIAQCGVIEYSGDLTTPPESTKKQRNLLKQMKRTIRSSNIQDSDSSDFEE